jgi:hypothetical protein
MVEIDQHRLGVEFAHDAGEFGAAGRGEFDQAVQFGAGTVRRQVGRAPTRCVSCGLWPPKAWSDSSRKTWRSPTFDADQAVLQRRRQFAAAQLQVAGSNRRC